MTTLKMTVNTYNRKSRINPEIYGSFSEHLGRCIYEGIYVGENSKIPNTNGIRNDVVAALKAIKLPVLRWPGGCFADEYHWKDGIGDRAKRKKMVNSHWGGLVEDNSFGTHEFFELCEQVGCEPYITGNLGSGTVAEMSEWIEYITFDGLSPMALERRKNGREDPWKLRYFGVGNENWGCGGNMRPEFYADQYRRYATYCREYSGNRLYKVACGPDTADYDWTDKIMANIKKDMSAISLHCYSWFSEKRACELTLENCVNLIAKSRNMEKLIKGHKEIMAKYDPEHKVRIAVDEWGTWYKTEEGTNPRFLYQQSTMCDAMVAAGTLDIFNRNSDIVSMANIAQTVNVLQAVLLTEGENMIKTPTYHVFDMYKDHQGNTLLDTFCENEKLEMNDTVYACSQSASINEKGEVFVTMSNCSADKPFDIDIELIGKEAGEISAKILASDDYLAHNSFDRPDAVKISEYTKIRETGKGMLVTLPPCSIAAIKVK
ncbi:MAG: alpha-L-arabinofuranosidase C-terminal domain-containing protein [Clostridia bacterium]